MTISPSAGTMAVPTLTNFLPNFRKRAIVEGKRPCGASSHACAKEYQGWLALQSMQNRQTRHRLLRPHQESFVGFSPSEKRNSHAARKKRSDAASREFSGSDDRAPIAPVISSHAPRASARTAQRMDEAST